LALLASFSGFVWHDQVEQDRALLQWHTEDICDQASRRLQVLVDSHLRVAAVFAQRWTRHPDSDFTEQRFHGFASVLLEQIRCFRALGIVQKSAGAVWSVPASSRIADIALSPEHRGVLEEARRTGNAVLSPPRRSGTSEAGWLAVIPLDLEGESLGHLVVDLSAERLSEHAYHERLRSEFSFHLEDQGQSQYRHTLEADEAVAAKHDVEASVSFAVQNRTWRLSMVPAPAAVEQVGWIGSVWVGVLGLFLSPALSLMVFLLMRRVALFRGARDRAVQEVEERAKVEAALRASEARYRNVFESATDGILVLSGEGRVIEANASARAIRGGRGADLVGCMWQSLFPRENDRHFERFRAELEDTGAARMEATIRCADGSAVNVDLRGAPLGKSEELRILVIMTDISRSKQAMNRLALLSRQVLLAQEEERARLSRELHDELGQIITAMRLQMGAAQGQLRSLMAEAGALKQNAPAAGVGGAGVSWRNSLPGRKADPLEKSVELAERVADGLRRVCRGLRPPLLDDLGLEPAARQLIKEYEESTGISTSASFHFRGPCDAVPPDVALGTYRILQEALSNAARHSRCQAVLVSLVCSSEELAVTVEDNGVGFEPDVLGVKTSFGLEGMRERASLVGGSVEIHSSRGEGTRVTLRIPCSANRELEAC